MFHIFYMQCEVPSLIKVYKSTVSIRNLFEFFTGHCRAQCYKFSSIDCIIVIERLKIIKYQALVSCLYSCRMLMKN